MKLLSMSSFVPEQVCDVIRFTGYKGNTKVSHYCGYAADYISQVLEDESIDGAVFPRSCDSTRVIDSYLQDIEKFVYKLHVPAINNQLGKETFAETLREYHSEVCSKFNIGKEDLLLRTQIVNQRNQKLRKQYDHIEEFRYSSYLKQIHEALVLPLEKQKIENPELDERTDCKEVYIVGSYLSNLSIIEKIEQVGLKIVGDNITESKRLFGGKDVRCDTDDIYMELAENILDRQLSPTQDNFEPLIDDDIEEITRKKVKGVIFVTQKFCEPYDYLYSVYKKKLVSIEIPTLHIVLNDSLDLTKTDLLIEAFADTL